MCDDDDANLDLPNFTQFNREIEFGLIEQGNRVTPDGIVPNDTANRTYRWMGGQMNDAGAVVGDLGETVLFSGLNQLRGLRYFGAFLKGYDLYKTGQGIVDDNIGVLQEYIDEVGYYFDNIEVKMDLFPNDPTANTMWIVNRCNLSIEGIIWGQIPDEDTGVDKDGGLGLNRTPGDATFETITQEDAVYFTGSVVLDDDGGVEGVTFNR